MKSMIILYDNADMREIFSSRGDLMEEMAYCSRRSSSRASSSRPSRSPTLCSALRGEG